MSWRPPACPGELGRGGALWARGACTGPLGSLGPTGSRWRTERRPSDRTTSCCRFSLPCAPPGKAGCVSTRSVPCSSVLVLLQTVPRAKARCSRVAGSGMGPQEGSGILSTEYQWRSPPWRPAWCVCYVCACGDAPGSVPSVPHCLPQRPGVPGMLPSSSLLDGPWGTRLKQAASVLTLTPFKVGSEVVPLSSGLAVSGHLTPGHLQPPTDLSLPHAVCHPPPIHSANTHRLPLGVQRMWPDSGGWMDGQTDGRMEFTK